MDVTTITQLIGALGFPIACCVALFWYMIKEKDAHKAEMEELRKIYGPLADLICWQLLSRCRMIESINFIKQKTIIIFNIMDNLIKELDLQAQKHISGGFWDWVVGTFLGGMLYDLTFHTGETIESFNAGRDAANAMWNK